MDIAALRETHYNATILQERILHGTVMVFRVQPDNPIPAPQAGQWLELGLGAWEPVMEGAEPGSTRRSGPEAMIRRAYSISSPILNETGSGLPEAGTQAGFEFFLSLVIPPAARAGKVPNLTGRLFCLRQGDRLFLSETPMGEYTLAPVKEGDDILFLSTGTGEAPHNAMIAELLRNGHTGRIAHLVCVRHADDLAYDSAHRRLAGLFPGYRYHPLATRDPGGDPRHFQDYLREGSLDALAGFPMDPAKVRVFLCGNPGMIGPPRLLQGVRVFPEEPGMVQLLESLGFDADHRTGTTNVHFERFW